MKTIRKVHELVDAGFIESEAQEKIEQVTQKFSLSLPPHVVDILHLSAGADREALKKQFIPSQEELDIKASELSDPIGDFAHSAVKGIVHRHADRCLLMPVSVCPVYCRFCFRREVVGKKEHTLSKIELEQAFHYIKAHPEIWEVILTGGDPFILKPKKIAELLAVLDEINHVEVVRIHTRIPVLDPSRITQEMIDALRISKAVYVALHINHPAEFTDLAQKTVAQFVEAGIPLLSQTVLLKGVNDSVEVLGKLMRILVRNRIKPYYLHHADLAKGTSHFRTSIKEGQALMRALRSQYSGLCQPTYVLDIPGGGGKVPLPVFKNRCKDGMVC